jgi:hypothetical protein
VVLLKLIIYSALYLSVASIQKGGIIKFICNQDKLKNKKTIKVKVIDNNKYKISGYHSKYHHIYLNEEELKIFIHGIGGKIIFKNLNEQGAIIEVIIPIELKEIIESDKNKKIIYLDDYKKGAKYQ